MNYDKLKKILDEHKLHVDSSGKSGSRADFRCADLNGAGLGGVNLRCVNLRGADLGDAYMRGAYMRCADMSDTNLKDAILIDADLVGADFRGADMSNADLRDADLSNADLRGANLRGTYLFGANLRNAHLPDRTYVIMGEKYPISITNGKYLRAGFENHTIKNWRKFTKDEIDEMDGNKLLRFYPRLLDIVDFYLGKGTRPEWLNTPGSTNW
ncbi:pentapeptide repeat-containing protein [Proteus sp. G2661]|uniref:pentapeptide repeat-containing protein n=1 Tax=Proteus sp. G2661 TaxID=2698874 RepID=UPI0013776F9C|nr:pentapeptide repeat-containing protein [Proteus sp. G2661]NBM86335.1 pentapeptide repeat-containing protein [Proteus sp. G2661]